MSVLVLVCISTNHTGVKYYDRIPSYPGLFLKYEAVCKTLPLNYADFIANSAPFFYCSTFKPPPTIPPDLNAAFVEFPPIDDPGLKLNQYKSFGECPIPNYTVTPRECPLRMCNRILLILACGRENGHFAKGTLRTSLKI